MSDEVKTREDIDLYYLRMAKLVSGRSTCIRRDVGAIIVDPNNRVISTGYNGVPSGMPHCKFGHPCAGANCPSGTGLDLCLAIHAETNAIIQSEDRLKFADTIYVTASPCIHCTKLILCTPIRRIVFSESYPAESFNLWNAAGRREFDWVHIPMTTPREEHPLTEEQKDDWAGWTKPKGKL